jgi:hypothetical protein
MTSSRAAKRFVVIAICGACACGVPAGAQILKKEPDQILKKEPDADQLACGQKVLVENNTCPADQILEITGSCIKTTAPVDLVRAPKGMQYNCIKRK